MNNDEFLLFTKGDQELLDNMLSKYQSKMDAVAIRYNVSSAFKTKEDEPIRNLIFEAERINKLKSYSSRD